MKIMVFDVAAESGGALTILKQYHSTAQLDIENEWFFIVSVAKLEHSSNINVLYYPWIKKSWFHRLFFDNFVAPKLVTKYQINKVISLQNIMIPRVKAKQIIYMHQSLPFVDYKFGIFKNFKYWVYQNIIGRLIISSIKRADEVIVQTQWIKKAIHLRSKCDIDKISVIAPRIEKINISLVKTIDKEMFRVFYPAAPDTHKNHAIIIDYLSHINLNFECIFTFSKEDNMSLNNMIIDKGLADKIKLIGKINHNRVIEYYKSSDMLIFPSEIETFGLPLAEAMQFNLPILVADKEYSREVLNGYDNAMFINIHDKKAFIDLFSANIKKY